MKHRRREPSSGVSSSRSIVSRATRGCIPKVPNFPALRHQRQEKNVSSNSKMTILPQPASSSTPATSITKSKRSSDRNRRSPSYYGFDNSSSDSTIAAPTKRSRRAGDFENFQPPPASVVETSQNISVQHLDETNISAITGDVSPPALQALSVLEQDTRTLVRSMTVFKAENQEMSD